MKHPSWFTFIEIVIAIFVFSVGILAVLQVMTRNLSLIAQSQTKTTAASFAQEWIALTFSLRDANRTKWYARDCIPSSQVFVVTQPTEEDFCQYRMQDLATSGWYLLLWFSPDQYMSIDVITTTWNTQLWSQTGEWYYVAYTGTTPTKYSRHIVFEPVYDAGIAIPTDNLLKVTSIVHYAQGAETGQVQLESFIWAR
jgi:prepilin-type N-terminal cleavage/methylation domain-containing protein